MGRYIILSMAILGLSIAVKDLNAASAPSKSIIAHAAVNARVLPLWVAREQGFFSKYGARPKRFSYGRRRPLWLH
jgi:ABC-type nitrate/sulfonate/bicarbonate transport system substrate-binding protein